MGPLASAWPGFCGPPNFWMSLRCRRLTMCNAEEAEFGCETTKQQCVVVVNTLIVEWDGQAALTAFGRMAQKLLLHFPVIALVWPTESHSLSHWWFGFQRPWEGIHPSLVQSSWSLASKSSTLEADSPRSMTNSASLAWMKAKAEPLVFKQL